jgi:hypothetical protein
MMKYVMVAGIAIHRFAVYDIDRLPYDLRTFYMEISK